MFSKTFDGKIVVWAGVIAALVAWGNPSAHAQLNPLCNALCPEPNNSPNPNCDVQDDCGFQAERTCDGIMGGTACSSNADCGPGESCCYTGNIDPGSPNTMCMWAPIEAAMPGSCDTLINPVDVRLCELGVLLDGSVSDEIALTMSGMGMTQVDLVEDVSGNSPGPTGDAEEPRRVMDPNGFNFGNTLLFFAPDSDPTDGIDDSFLYIGFDISDFDDDSDALIPFPFDSDDNASACEVDDAIVQDPGKDAFEDFSEAYAVEIQACTLEELFTGDPTLILSQRNPNSIGTNNDGRMRIRIDESFADPLETLLVPNTLVTRSFPTADEMTNPTNACIDNEVCLCGRGNDIEFLMESVETNGAFGPHSSASPDTDEARENRISLAQLLARLFADSAGDGGDEEFANVSLRTPVPDLEVRKRIRCAGTDDPFTDYAETFPGSEVEFEIVIENLGNEDLDVTIDDDLEDIATQMGLVSCAPVCESLQAFLTSPRRGLVDEPVNPGNAVSLGLDPQFFVDICANLDLGFLGSIRNDMADEVGELQGAIVQRMSGDCVVTDGDTLVLRFRGSIGTPDQAAFCDADPEDCDCANSVTVTGEIPDLPGNVVAQDEAGLVDTAREANSGACVNSGHACNGGLGLPCDNELECPGASSCLPVDGGLDDNVVTLNVLCNDFDFLKEVRLLPDGGFMTGDMSLTLPTGPFPLDIEYRFTASNNGEVDQDITINDLCLCDDVTNTAGVSFVMGECSLCEVDNGSSMVMVAAGGMAELTCQVRFDSQMALQTFMMADDGRPECRPMGVSPDDDMSCYGNYAVAEATADVDSSVCGEPPVISVNSNSTICNAPCEIEVTKQVRCLPECTADGLGAEEGWVDSPDQLEALPGACLQYRIIVENISSDVPVCALNYIDTMTGGDEFAGPPTDCQVEPAGTCEEVCPFDTTGAGQLCSLESLLQPGESVTVFFQRQLANDADPAVSPDNSVTVQGAGELDCPVGAAPLFSCEDSDNVGVDIQECDYTLEKDSSCDGTVWEPTVDALPGSDVFFRIRLCNTGDVALNSVELNEELSCADWFTAGSVAAEINGNDVTSCICPMGGCQTPDDLDGVKDLSACVSVEPGECLTITFSATVPADFDIVGQSPDCTNVITAQGGTDICGPDEDACPELTETSTVNVLIPDVSCDKTICADFNNDGTCDTDPTTDLQLPCDTAFPFTLEYAITANNDGETTLENVTVCDPELVADAQAAGLMFVNCVLDSATGCFNLGTLASTGMPDSSATAICQVRVPDRNAWEQFAILDADDNEDCYSNTAGVTGTADTDEICDQNAEPDVESSCSARVCLAPPCEIAVDKNVRCLEDCGDTGSDMFVDSLPATPGATIEFQTSIENTGDESICAVQVSDTLNPLASFTRCPTNDCSLSLVSNGSSTSCTLPVSPFPLDGTTVDINVFAACGALLGPGDELVLSCRGTIPGDATGTIENTLTANCAPDDGGNCQAAPPVYCGEPMMDDADVDIDPCDYTLDKDVSCDQTTWSDATEALPGSAVWFRFEVCNTGEAAITQVDLDDSLSCAPWFVADSVTAEINGTDVLSCICPPGGCDSADDIDGLKDLTACQPIAAGECLTVIFQVNVPDDFDTVGQDPDCTNTIEADPGVDICSPEDPCPPTQASAEIDVVVPGITCDKTICADFDNDGTCDTAPTTDLQLPCDTDFPFTLEYEVTATNTGETTLDNVTICDLDLVTMAQNAGLTLVNCGLDSVTGCANVGSLLPSGTAAISCGVQVPSRDAWELFTGGGNCKTNTADVTGTSDTTAVCDTNAEPDVESECSAQACLARPCEIDVDKNVRCLDGCGDSGSDAFVDSLPATPGATIEFESRIENTGAEPICAVSVADTLVPPASYQRCGPNDCTLALVRGGSTTACTLPVVPFPLDGSAIDINVVTACGSLMLPGDELVLRCRGTIPDNATGMIENTIVANCAPDDGGNCLAEPPIFCGDGAEDDATVDIQECSFNLNKEASCDMTNWMDSVEALPGSDVWFRFEVCNDGDVSIPRLNLAETLSCGQWFVPGSVMADVEGTDVTSCICPMGGCNNPNDIDGHKDLTSCRVIAPGECLEVKFRVTVPAGFATVGQDPDCVNSIGVGPETDICGPDDACGAQNDTSTLNVLVPDVTCPGKSVCADFNNDGVCDMGPAAQLSLDGTEFEFPMSLIWQINALNNGEVPLNNVMICDPELVADATGPGIGIGPCDLLPTGCYAAPPLPPGGVASASCTVTFDSIDAYNVFAGRDGTADATYVNQGGVTALPDPTNETCRPDPLDELDSQCGASVNIDQVFECPPGGDCTPITKATVEVWNQNEDFFSGTDRCIAHWDQTLISDYTSSFGPNNFWISQLHTNKGKARFIGTASNVCDPPFCCERTDDICQSDFALQHDGEAAPICSEEIPFLGVAVKEIHFNGSNKAFAGSHMVGAGVGDGQILHTLQSPSDQLTETDPTTQRERSAPEIYEERIGRGSPIKGGGKEQDPPNFGGHDFELTEGTGTPPITASFVNTNRGSVSQKGSFLVFPNVELKWDRDGNLIQDTFLSVTNDSSNDVRIKLYFVHGDCCIWSDRGITLTGHESTYWSSFDGLPKGVTPFTGLGDGIQDPDDHGGQGIRRLAGYVLLWAEDAEGVEICWNHLLGKATIVSYQHTSAWEYDAWAFKAIGTGADGQPLQMPYGQLDLNGIEYEHVPGYLLLDFFAAGAMLQAPGLPNIEINTDVTLWPAVKDLRED